MVSRNWSDLPPDECFACGATHTRKTLLVTWCGREFRLKLRDGRDWVVHERAARAGEEGCHVDGKVVDVAERGALQPLIGH